MPANNHSVYTLFVTGIEFYGFHGVPAEEKVVGHRYGVDVELQVQGSADRTDKVSDTVDYGQVAQLVAEWGQGERVSTVERLARLMGERILENYPRVQSVLIRVAKLLPPAPVIAAEAGVELHLER